MHRGGLLSGQRHLACKLPLALAVRFVLQEVVDVGNQSWTGLHHLWVQQQLRHTNWEMETRLPNKL